MPCHPWWGQMTEHQLCESDQGFPCRSSQAALMGHMLRRCSGQRPLLSPTVLCTDSSTESQRCSASDLTLSSEPVCHWALQRQNHQAFPFTAGSGGKYHHCSEGVSNCTLYPSSDPTIPFLGNSCAKNKQS